MLSPTEEHRLRDLMTIQLLEATSHPDALARARAEARGGVAAYDPGPPPDSTPRLTQRVQPRDLVDACVLCGRAFVLERPTRVCSPRCARVVESYRRRRGLAA